MRFTLGSRKFGLISTTTGISKVWCFNYSQTHSEYGGSSSPFLASQVFWVTNLIFVVNYFSVLRLRQLTLPKQYVTNCCPRLRHYQVKLSLWQRQHGVCQPALIIHGRLAGEPYPHRTIQSSKVGGTTLVCLPTTKTILIILHPLSEWICCAG